MINRRRIVHRVSKRHRVFACHRSISATASVRARPRNRARPEISQEYLAYRVGVNRSYMSKLEKGASYPGLEIIAKLATVLEVEPAELIRLPASQPTPRL